MMAAFIPCRSALTIALTTPSPLPRLGSQAAAAPPQQLANTVASLRRLGLLPKVLQLAVATPEGRQVASCRVSGHTEVGALLRALEQGGAAAAGSALYHRGQRLAARHTATQAGLRDGDALEVRA